ncbi:MAG: dihydrofolate reductase [Bacteroidetes bacterium CG02_land_8_20_14_3_00_31_25]|nr:dihydrofolate reductase [Bacteroidota bacterium]PIV59046.1 MAG: dihydrofolate reductase [Bacteroidetes bacterium CG02_land_8_20_14_3_00_31_25]PIX35841.1 MAG: dihydrofolate reductase [Bacteroidetes bacterium CG_4_8_14_3_um_filter_31_14]PIY02933.1 MAG: dihydrofolate reductase [Bacteroidetes bacterium CG_4_10_14_3_um_filter_31_20]
MKNLSIIVAIASNYAIGKNNDLLWHISEDLKHFKKITLGHPVIMGKKTFESLPIRPLPGRENIVLTDVAGETIPGCTMVYSIPQILTLCKNKEDCFVIGGSSVYKQFLQFAETLYITWVHKAFEADVFFPEISEKKWQITETEKHHSEENNFDFSFVIYKRKK